VPYYTFQGHRTQLLQWAEKKESKDALVDQTSSSVDHDTHPDGGLRAYWQKHTESLDGLPSLQSCFTSEKSLGDYQPISTNPDDHKVAAKSGRFEWGFTTDRAGTLLAGIALGVALSHVASRVLAVLPIPVL
jgi:hypothetical protein